ncbi:MAG TPA: PLP-dependent aminotransferase family protein [Candidatus Baltobacteraceae bacterium]|nr:PLP-dependent aminotransferase family protein [Candidatus Baltobacteraceae bacterium]
MREPLNLEPLFPDRSTGEPLASQLVRRLRGAIERGTLPAGTRMLGTRQLAKRLGLGRNTVAVAFEQLIAEGYFEARSGSGTYVTSAPMKRSAPRPLLRTPQVKSAEAFSPLRSLFEAAAGQGPLRPGMPDLAAFPRAAWIRSAREALDIYDGELGYSPANGLPSLAQAIALHVQQFRGIAAQPQQIVVVEGAQAGMHLAATVLAAAGDAIAIEDPCYALARAAFEARGLKLRAVSVDREGLDVDRLPSKVRFAFVTPTHQFPLGGTLPLTRRLALLDWAKKQSAYIIEDDYDSEFTSKARPLPALQSLDREERVVYIGSFSKTLAPGIRLGYVIAPPHLARAFRLARAASSLGAAIHLQATAATFIARGYLARHLRRMNVMYDRRRLILIEALRDLTSRGFELGPASTGLHVALMAKRRFNDRSLSSIDDHQRLVTLSSLCLRRRDCQGFVLGFTNGSDEEISRAASALAGLLRPRA